MSTTHPQPTFNRLNGAVSLAGITQMVSYKGWRGFPHTQPPRATPTTDTIIDIHDERPSCTAQIIASPGDSGAEYLVIGDR
jgi:hypothetical protein